MKTILKHYIIDTASLYLITFIVSGIVFKNGVETILLAGFALMLTTLVIQPIINLLLLPINLVTFGLFKWVTYAITLYLVTLAVPGFKLLDFAFHGFSNPWFPIPAFTVTGPLAFIAFSFLISTISSIIYWIFK